MAYAMAGLVDSVEWSPGDMVIVNDPYLGGTHLPDITLIAPEYAGNRCAGYVANRAHHADVGAQSPGSMPVSRTLAEEGLVIPPMHLLRNHATVSEAWTHIVDHTASPVQMRGDLAAQVSANRAGITRLQQLLENGADAYLAGLAAINDYGARLAEHALSGIPNGTYRFEDVMDDDGMGNVDICIAVELRVQEARVDIDFTGTAGQVAGNINCPLSVAAAAVFYVFRCLMPSYTPACAGSFRTLHIHAPHGCLVNATRPAAVAAGNVETSSRIVDVIMGALAQALPGQIPAASQGTMNNIAMGARTAGFSWDYYETLGGGTGGSCRAAGLDAVQSHMTNTLNTPIEVLEMAYPLRVRRYAVRSGSGGAGRHAGGNGMVREYEFLAPANITLLSERRLHAPWGLAEGAAGQPGENKLNDKPLPGKVNRHVDAGDCLSVFTPGGGGWGQL
jgi:N-methylhydantoinase B